MSTREVLWTHVPFEFGIHNDMAIINLNLQIMLALNEFVVADRGYTYCKVLSPSTDPDFLSNYYEKISARHEMLNS